MEIWEIEFIAEMPGTGYHVGERVGFPRVPGKRRDQWPSGQLFAQELIDQGKARLVRADVPTTTGI